MIKLAPGFNPGINK